MRDRPPTVASAAHNLAAWHRASVLALGIDERTSRSWWTCDIRAPSIWFTAISRSAHAGARGIRHVTDDPDLLSVVCDSFDALDLADRGLRRERRGLWFGRPAGRVPPSEDPVPCDIVAVTDRALLADYEQVAAAAFGTPFLPAPFDIHGPAILEDAAMSIWLGRLDGEPVAGAMAYDHDGVRGIYGVGTIGRARRMGIATAMTAHALSLAPDRPATLQPSHPAERIYRSLGFVEIGRWSVWV